MLIRYGFEMTFHQAQDVPMVLLLDVHPSRRRDLVRDEGVAAEPAVPLQRFIDRHGNVARRLVAPAGCLTLRGDGVVRDTGEPDPVVPEAEQVPVEDLPDDVLIYLMGSRYCETDKLMNLAWSLFGAVTPGWQRVQAICDYVHDRIAFGYHHARPTRTAHEAHEERAGVCRDYAHLAVALCRCMNIPARYCNGYLGDIGVPPVDLPMDFNAWFEAYLGHRWYTFDARHNTPRIGRILIARGRDATDVAMTTGFGAQTLAQFRVWTDEVKSPAETGSVVLSAVA